MSPKTVEYLVRVSRNRVTAGRFGEAGRPLSKAFNTDKAHCLRRLAAEYGALPSLALRKLRRVPALVAGKSPCACAVGGVL